MKGLSPRQAQCLRFLIRYQQEHQRPPTQEELADGLMVSTQASRNLCRRLATKGYIVTQPHRPPVVLKDTKGRSIRLRWEYAQ